MIRMSSLLLAIALLNLGGCQAFLNKHDAETIPAAQSPDESASLHTGDRAVGAEQVSWQSSNSAVAKLAGPDIPAPNGMSQRPEPSAAERFDALFTGMGQVAESSALPPLQLEQVRQSVVEKFPLIQSVMQEAQVTAGKQRSARGAFDVKLMAESLNMPLGFYENYRHLVKVEQPTWMGGAIYGQYRIGDGSFQPWYGERETNEGGEFKLGFVTPLLRGRDIDERRAQIARADLEAAAVDPQVDRQLLESVQLSAYVYWSWVAAGQIYLITQDLLGVAEERDRAIRRQVELGNLGQTEQQLNERLIVSRQAKLIEAKRKLQSAAIKLSLFLRDENGEPIIPVTGQLPPQFPEPNDPRDFDARADINLALDRRPELRELQLARRMVDVDMRLSENELLPNLNTVMEASQDVGAQASDKGDKTPFELEAGILFDVPIQRNIAYGKIQTSRGKLTQIALKQKFTCDKIVSEVRDAYSALMAAFERIAKARRNVELAHQLVKAEYRSFELGNSDVLRIGIQEGSELDARYLATEALLDYYQALAQYQAAIAQR